MAPWSALLRRTAPWLASCLVLANVTPSHAQTVTLTRDYDLVDDSGLVHYSQTDGRWAYYSIRRDPSVTIGRCGCLLSAFATVINQQGGMLPWFPTAFDYFGGSNGAFDFNPRYLDIFLNYGPNPSGNPGLPNAPFPPGWGYKERPDGTCGVIPLLQALQSVGNDGFGHPIGFTPVVHHGFGPDVKNIVNRNLLAGRPTIAAIRVGDSPVANHAVLIAGWDQQDGVYKILDPMTPRLALHGLNYPEIPYASRPGDPPEAPATYQAWEATVEGIIEMRLGGFNSQPSFLFGDDPSPIEILMTGPDGRRTGVDAATGTSYADNDGASYWTFGPWRDPLNEAAPSTSPRFISVPNAASGIYHFTVTGVASGPLALSAETLFGGRRVRVGEFSGAIAAGEVRKYELNFSRTGTSTVAQVANFTPHAFAGDDLNARTDTPIRFDARRSFDVDGALVSFAWDFGDGDTGVGPQPQHIYAVPGSYTVTLTVTDANGVTATDALVADVILSQRRPIAHASGPYIGFASSDPRWYVLLDARGSSDPNGDPLTYRWDFGDGTPIRTTTTPFVDHTYAALGSYTATLIVNDGLDDSAPTVAAVRVVQAPTSPPFGTVNAVLTPNCGSPGDELTITIGEFAQFQWWDAGTMGPVPSFPPRRLPLGLSVPDGLMALGDRDVPFYATLLGPGRYLARATLTIPDDAQAGIHQLLWAEDDTIPYQVPCPTPANRAPIADAGGPYTAEVGAAVAFDGSASSDPDGDALTYAWDFGDGESGEGVRPTHTYAHPGRYLVTLIVSDGRARSSAVANARGVTTATITSGTPGPTDRTGPTILGMPEAGCSIWPAIHRFVKVAKVSATDGESGLAPNGLSIVVTSSDVVDIASDVIVEGGVVGLRAERSAEGVGRSYTITATATDRAGNVTRASATCKVPDAGSSSTLER